MCVDNELDALRVAGIAFGYPGGCDPVAGEWRACWSWSDTAARSGWGLPAQARGLAAHCVRRVVRGAVLVRGAVEARFAAQHRHQAVVEHVELIGLAVD